METVAIVLLLVTAATVVAVTARRLSVPAPSLLVVVGVVVGLIPAVPTVYITPALISLIVLPLLLHAAGEELSARDLRDVWRPVTVLAVGLVLASAAVVAVVAHAITPMGWTMAFVLGAVLASTDPVAVTALGRRLSLPARVHALVQAESLFNDATSLILFRLAVTAAVLGGGVGVGATALQFLVLAGGGVAVGVGVAALAAGLRRYPMDPVVETVISLVTPYAAYLVAEFVHGSGVTAVVVASVILGVLGPRLTSPATRLQLHAVHATAVFILESVVFGLIGLELPALVREEHRTWVVPAIVLTLTLVLVRMAWVYPLGLFPRWRGPAGRWRMPAVVSWAGARGVVPLAAALSIPLLDASGGPLPYRSLVLILAIGVIVVSLVGQGFTLAPLVRWSGVAVPSDARRDEYVQTWQRLTEVGLSYIDSLEGTETTSPAALEAARRSLRASAAMATGDSAGASYRELRHDILACQRAELRRMYAAGEISDPARRTLQRQLDQQAERLGGP